MFCVRFDKNAAQRKIHFCVKTWRGVLEWNVRFFGGRQNYSHTIPILSARKAPQYFVYRMFIAGYHNDKKQDHKKGGITKDFWVI